MLRALAVALSLLPVGQFDKPVFVAAPPGDTHRIFVVEKTGAIRIVKDGQELPEPFLSLAGQVSGDSEQGLLSMAFAPDYATSGHFYVDYTATSGNSQVVEYRVSSNPDVADASTARTILSQDQPEPNHNGGQLQFGPDGDLYVGFGDGGGAGDDHGTIGNGQNLQTWLGKILRVDPRPSGGRSYTVPAGNPALGGLPEIWAYGLRNPWRFSFDSATGDLWIGDVGQDTQEEIDHAARGAGGQNYGWRLCEGTHDFDGSCATPGLTAPVLTYTHDNGRCAVTGGDVVHDPGLTDLDGAYVYGDYCTGEIWAVRPPAAPQPLPGTLPGLSSFGLDGCGHLYAMSSDSGKLVRFEEGGLSACAGSSSGCCPTTPLRGRDVALRVHRRVSRSGRVAVRVGCSRAFAGRCRVTLTLRRGRHRAAATRRLTVRAGSSRTVHDRLTRRLRRSLSHHHRVAIRASAVARDASGSARRSVRVRLSR